MAAKLLLRFGFLLSTATAVFGLSEQGVWDLTVEKKQYLPFIKSLYNNSVVSVKIVCSSTTEKTNLMINWMLRWTPCANEYPNIQNNEDVLRFYMQQPQLDEYVLDYPITKYHMSKFQKVVCDGNPVTLLDESALGFDIRKMVKTPNETVLLPSGPVAAKVGATTVSKRLRRDAKSVPAEQKVNNKAVPQSNKMGLSNHDENDMHVVVQAWEDGIYLFVLHFNPEDNLDGEFKVDVSVRIKGPAGYLSAIEWPLLPFYGTMCVVYVIMALVWMVLSACNWRDVLRIQFWIGAVILLGMLEKAVFFAEYSSINVSGKSVRGAVIFAELVSCFKRTLARMLVVIVSLGFGIVKPRLGPMLHRVLGMGALYFILGSVEGCLRILKPKSDVSRNVLLAKIPLAVLDAAICWWVFISLVQTTRTLRLRRNLVKLSLYRHFTNTLIFAVLASVAFMIWSIKQHKLINCLTDWKEIWVDDAFWHLLFSVLLLIIMILWRPNNNNQRYAFSPLLDAADDEAEEPMINDAYEGMKMRGNSTSRSTSPKPKEVKNKPEDDLKWIEENIPASVTDAAIPGLLDSDEEIMTTKFEMSKME